jgi:hypothetical protein
MFVTGGLDQEAAYRERLAEVIRRDVIFFRSLLSPNAAYTGA